MLQRLKKSLYAGKNKYELKTTETEFFGLTVGKNEVKISDERKRVVKEWPKAYIATGAWKLQWTTTIFSPVHKTLL